MLNDLANRGEIPKLLIDMAHSLRYFRNIGAHASEIELDSRDAAILKDLCDTILEYVYEAPRKLKNVQDQINNMKTRTSSSQTGN